MKKLSFVMCAMLIALCTVFVSCKKDAPSIKFTYNGVEKKGGTEVDAKVGEEITITVEYDAPGDINQILLNVIGTYYYKNITYTSFSEETTHKITETIKFEEAGDAQIKTFVKDKQEDALTTNFELKVRVKY
jgi:hypothetical protein